MFRLLLLATAASTAMAPAALAQTAPASPPPTAAPRPQPAPAVEPGTVQGVTVTGQREGMRSEIDRRSYSVANDLRASSGSVAEVLRNVPSVEVDVQGNVSLRGDPNVQIMIDGRPSGMFNGAGRADALQSLPADQIDRIEVMTNPSAAFRPDGAAGIINLVTKKNRRPGKYATLRGNVGTGGRANGGVTGAYTTEKVTLSGDLTVRQDRQQASITNERERLVGGQLVESRQSGEIDNRARGVIGRVGIDYDPNPQNRLSAEVRHFDLQIDSDNPQFFELENAAGAVANAFERRGGWDLDRQQSSVGATWRRKFTGEQHELVTDFLFDRTDAYRETDADLFITVPAPETRYEDVISDIRQDMTRLKVDYNRPVGDSARLKTGYEFEFQDNSYDSVGRRGTDPDASPLDPNLTNLFLHEQTVHGVYVTYDRPFGAKLRAQGGLRAEQVDVHTNQVTSGQVDEQDYFKIYPSLHLAYEVSERQKLSASYSLRTQRPNEDFLNPYVIYIDPLNRRAGNPLLRPQETHSFELGWQYRHQQTYYLATLYFRDSSDGITEVTEDLGGGVFLTTFENLGERRAGGLELVANGPIGKKLTYQVSGNAFWQEIEASNLGFTEPRSGTSLSLRGNLTWTPTPKDVFQVNAVLNGRQLLPQGYVEPFGLLNLGYRHKVSEALSLVVTAQDVLDTIRREVVIDTPTLKDRTVFDGNARAVFVGFTYNFAKGPPRKQQQPGFDFGGASVPST
ncbi:MAG TPA: TonB-dependent receptor [Caulobacteraceae bacterium]